MAPDQTWSSRSRLLTAFGARRISSSSRRNARGVSFEPDQQFQQTERTWREAHRLTAAKQRLLIAIETELVKAKPGHRKQPDRYRPLTTFVGRLAIMCL